MTFSNQALSRALRGFVNLCHHNRLGKRRAKLDRIRIDWEDNPATVKWLIELYKERMPRTGRARLLKASVSAFGDRGRDRAVALSLWALMDDGRHALPFSREECLAFICAFFEASLEDQWILPLRKEVHDAVREARERSLNERWFEQALKERFANYLPYEKFVRGFKELIDACAACGLAEHDLYEMFKYSIVRTATKLAAEIAPPSSSRTGT